MPCRLPRRALRCLRALRLQRSLHFRTHDLSGVEETEGDHAQGRRHPRFQPGFGPIQVLLQGHAVELPGADGGLSVQEEHDRAEMVTATGAGQ